MTCTHKLSLVQGIYVILHGDTLAATCNTKDLLEEYLDGVSYQDAHKVRMFLSAVDDFDTDEVTHLIACDMFEDDKGRAYADYQEWAELTGWTLPWLEFWFDEFNNVHSVDRRQRVQRHNEINGVK